MKRLLIAACLPALAILPQPALADGIVGGTGAITAIGRSDLRHGWLAISDADMGSTLVARVATSDLDLGSEAGRLMLKARLRHASDDLCRAALADPELPADSATANRRCRADAQAQWLQRMNLAANFLR